MNNEPLYAFTGFRFSDKDHGYAVGRERDFTRFYVTENGGRKWSELIFEVNEKINNICFCSKEHGWAVGDNGLVLHSTDSGVSWTRLETGVSEDFTDVMFISEDLGLICGRNGALLKVEAR